LKEVVEYTDISEHTVSLRLSETAEQEIKIVAAKRLRDESMVEPPRDAVTRSKIDGMFTAKVQAVVHAVDDDDDNSDDNSLPEINME
jgi:hypothetical protein